MIDWLTKELINEWYWNNIDEDRSCIKSERINGRLYDKYGVDCATTAVGFEYKVFDPSINKYKYAILIGFARQNPGDTVLNKKTGYEIASENALINPSIMLVEDNEATEDFIYSIIDAYVLSLPIKFIKTKSELIKENKDLNIYNRGKNANDYYSNYYCDFKKKFMNKSHNHYKYICNNN